jgi:nucleoside-diphosphate-sugar epimerase
MKKVILTGATGFIGRQCIPFLLEKDYEVHAVTYGTASPVLDGVNIVRHSVDLLNPEHIKNIFKAVRPTHLLHLAWYTEHGLFWQSNSNIDWVISSLHCVTEFARNGGKRVIAAGTCAEYDWSYGYCSEDVTPLQPSNLYGISKNSLNKLLNRYAIQNDLSYAWGRIFFLYGPFEYNKRIIPYVITSLMRNKPADCSHGKQVRDFLHVEDVAHAFVSLLDSTLEGDINIASGVPVSIRSIVERIGVLMNKSDLIRLGARPSLPDDPPVIFADVRRLNNELSWYPKYELDMGLQSAIAWWDKYTNKKDVSVL